MCELCDEIYEEREAADFFGSDEDEGCGPDCEVCFPPCMNNYSSPDGEKTATEDQSRPPSLDEVTEVALQASLVGLAQMVQGPDTGAALEATALILRWCTTYYDLV